MRTKMFYAIAIAICGAVGMNSCTKDYDDDLRIQRELIESNESNIKAELAAYQTLIDNTIKQMEIAYKNSDEILKQELQAKFDLTKRQLEELSNALNVVKDDLGALKGNYEEFKETVNLALQVINTEIGAINDKIENQEDKITALDGRMVTAEAAIAELKAWKTLAEGQLAALSTDNEANETAIGKLKDDINTINWELKTVHRDVFDYVKGLIAMRKAHPAFRMGDADKVRQHLEFLPVEQDNVIAFCLKGKPCGDTWDNILVVLNARQERVTVDVPAGNYRIVCKDGKIDMANGLGRMSGSRLEVAPRSALIMHQ